MRTVHNYTLAEESYEEQREAGRHNPATQVVYKNRAYTIGAGTSDSIDVFIDENLLFVVSTNNRIGYAGVEVFDVETGGFIGEAFLQSEEEARETLGPRGLDYHPRTIATRLADYALV